MVRSLGDKILEATTPQHRGALAGHAQQYGRAGELHKKALNLLQEMNHEGVMLTCNLADEVERAQNSGQ